MPITFFDCLSGSSWLFPGQGRVVLRPLIVPFRETRAQLLTMLRVVLVGDMVSRHLRSVRPSIECDYPVAEVLNGHFDESDELEYLLSVLEKLGASSDLLNLDLVRSRSHAPLPMRGVVIGEIRQAETFIQGRSGGDAETEPFLGVGQVSIDSTQPNEGGRSLRSLDLLLSRYEPLVLRYFLLNSAHYRNGISLNEHSLDSAASRVSYFYQTLSKAQTFVDANQAPHEGAVPHDEFIKSLRSSFDERMGEDFKLGLAMTDVGKAFQVLNELADTRKRTARPAASLAIRQLLSILSLLDESLNLFSESPSAYLERHRLKAVVRRGIEPVWIEKRITERIAARTARNWDLADKIRDELEQLGVVLMDHDSGTDWLMSDTQHQDRQST